MRYEVHPTVGIARVGDSPVSFFLAPECIGGLPLECDANGDGVVEDGRPQPVRSFKCEGRIRRQAARFRLFAYDESNPDDPGREVTLGEAGVEGIEWTVHLANKKPVWYSGAQFDGNTMLGEWHGIENTNSYQAKGVPFRNAGVTDPAERQSTLIVDPGPRSVSAPHARAEVSRESIPADYPHGSFPDPTLRPYPIDSLGEIRMDADGRLLVLGGHGKACGSEIIGTFTGADSWYDDISDGPVTCRISLGGDTSATAQAWVVVGAPDYAPQVRNIVTLDDVIYDVGVRFQRLVPDFFDADRWPDSRGWNPGYVANFDRDIRPIVERPADYVWVANVPSMVAFSAPKFDAADASAANRANRENYLSYFRNPGEDEWAPELAPEHQVLMAPQGIPFMPLNAGSNPVTNSIVDKMMSLTPTQYRLLVQWAAGSFQVSAFEPPPGVHPLDQASVGNCSGHPMSPGWEMSWNTRNPALYAGPYVVKHRYGEEHYRANGLSIAYDECMRNESFEFEGCEPGDLTKRMSSPWQADFYQCSIEYVSFDDPDVNVDDATGIPPPPTYYAYWWPPQAPMYVMSGAATAEEQLAAGVPAGFQVYFSRGANNIARLVVSWKYLGFVVNQNVGDDGRNYPYMVEVERNHDEFVVGSVAVGQAINQLAASGSYEVEDNYFTPFWYLKDDEGAGGVRRRRL